MIYQDENIAVLYKPAHLLCHSDRTGDANLVDAFAAYLEAKASTIPTPSSALPRPCATGWTAIPEDCSSPASMPAPCAT